MILTEQAAPITRCKAHREGRGIALRGYSPELLQFYHTLPNARFDKLRKLWTCSLTPMTLWRIGLRDDVGLDDELDGLYREHLDALRRATEARDGANGLAQPPIRTTEAWSHQLRGFWFGYPLQAVLLAEDMGVGKTKNALDLALNWHAEQIIVLCPKSVLGVWRREIDLHAGGRIRAVVLDRGDTRRKIVEAATALAMAQPRSESVAVIVNYDTARTSAFAAWSLGQEWDLAVCDESHKIAHPQTAQSKYAALLGSVAKRRLCLTGTPMGQSPLDLFGQFKFLDPGLFGTSWTSFKARYAICANPYIPQQITGFRNQEELRQLMALLTYRCKASEVLDLPPIHHMDRRFTLGSEAQRHYRQLEQDFITEIKGGTVTAANALVKLLRLQQVTSGYLVPETDDSWGAAAIEEIDHAKADLLEELLSDLDTREPVIVFCRFRPDLERIRRIGERLGRRCGEISGRHKDLTDRGTMPTDLDLLAVQIQAGGLGIDLSRASYGFWYSLSFSLTEFDQSVARLHRPGQAHPVHCYHLVGEGTVDAAIYRALEKRREIIEEVLRVFSKPGGKAAQNEED